MQPYSPSRNRTSACWFFFCFVFHTLADGDVALRTASAVFSASFTDPLFKLITNQPASSGLFSFSDQLLAEQNYARWMRSLRDNERLLNGSALHNAPSKVLYTPYGQKFVDTLPSWPYVRLPQACKQTLVYYVSVCCKITVLLEPRIMFQHDDVPEPYEDKVGLKNSCPESWSQPHWTPFGTNWNIPDLLTSPKF